MPVGTFVHIFVVARVAPTSSLQLYVNGVLAAEAAWGGFTNALGDSSVLCAHSSSFRAIASFDEIVVALDEPGLGIPTAEDIAAMYAAGVAGEHLSWVGA